MLAEIFMVKLEAAARVSSETAPVSDGRFVPFTRSTQVTFKERRDPPVEAAREKASTGSL